ncbi:SCP2 domain-containing protein [Colwelliaceae bacterium BS250]
MNFCTRLPNYLPKLARFSTVIVPIFLQQTIIDLAVNKVLKESLVEGELDFLETQYLKISVQDINVDWFFTVLDERVVVSNKVLDADVTITGDLNSFVQLAAQTVDPDTLFFKRKLLIEGNVELGLAIKNLLDRVELTELATPIKALLVGYANSVHS